MVETFNAAVFRHLKLRLRRMTADYGSGSRACLTSEDIRVEDVAGMGRDLMPTSGRPVVIITQRDVQLVELQPPVYRTYQAIDGTWTTVKAVARVRQIYGVEFQCTIDDMALGVYAHKLAQCLVQPRRFAYNALRLETAIGGVDVVNEVVSLSVGNVRRRPLERYIPTGQQDPMGQALYTVEQVGAMLTVEVEVRTHIIEATSQKATAGIAVSETEVESGA